LVFFVFQAPAGGDQYLRITPTTTP
jgi:hypothetical protein